MAKKPIVFPGQATQETLDQIEEAKNRVVEIIQEFNALGVIACEYHDKWNELHSENDLCKFRDIQEKMNILMGEQFQLYYKLNYLEGQIPKSLRSLLLCK